MNSDDSKMPRRRQPNAVVEFLNRQLGDSHDYPPLIERVRAGEVRLLLDDVPSVAEQTGVDPKKLLCVVLLERHPRVHELLLEMGFRPVSVD